MPLTTRLKKEQALRAAGIHVLPYPTKVEASGTQIEQDRALLQAGSKWEIELDRAYLRLVAQPKLQACTELEIFERICGEQGIHAALAQLNARVPHRYTAAYRLEGELLTNIELVDKAGEDRPEFLAAVPLGSSFCQYVLRDGIFRTSDSARDDRLNGHPYKGVMIAYHGVPLLSPTGELFGSLCHFDVQSQPLSDSEFMLLQSAAVTLTRFLGPYQPAVSVRSQQSANDGS